MYIVDHRSEMNNTDTATIDLFYITFVTVPT